MKVPPRGDALRPLFIAASSAQGLGVIHLIIGGLIIGLMILHLRDGATFAQLQSAVLLHCVILIFPGILYIIFSAFMQRRRVWAVIAALVLASLQTLSLLLMTASFLIWELMGGMDLKVLMTGGVMGIILAGYFVMIVQLARSFPSLKAGRTDLDRGFAPILTVQAEPAAPPATTDRTE